MKALRYLLAAVFFGGALLGGTQQRTSPAMNDYLEGIKARNAEGDAARAAELFRRALEADSLHAPSLFELSRLLPPGEALPYIERAARLDTANRWYDYQLAQLYMETERYDSALAVCKRIVRRDPDNMEMYKNMAAIYDILDSPFAAIALLDSLEARFGIHPAVSGFKRQLLVRTRMYDKAIAETRSLAENFPYEASYWVELAKLYQAQGGKADSLALDAYRKAMRVDSADLNTLTALSDFYLHKKMFPSFFTTLGRIFGSDDMDAPTKIRFFNEVLKQGNYYRSFYFQVDQLASQLAVKYPEDAAVRKFYAGHLAYSGRVEEALAKYKAEAERDVRDVEVYDRILAIESYLDRPDSVLLYSDRALKMFPDSTGLYVTRAGAFYAMDMYPEAVRTLEQAFRYARTDSLRSFLTGLAGDFHQQAGDRKKAYRCYRRALEYDPGNVAVLNNYSYNLSEEGKDLDRALEMAARVMEKEGSNPTYIDTYAWALYKLGRYAEAKEAMLKAVALDATGDKEIFLHYGDILHALGEDFNASIYWRKALEKGADKEAVEERLEKLEGKQ